MQTKEASQESEIKQVIRSLCMMNNRFMNFMLDDNKKADLKDNYKKIFKNTMLKCKFEDKSFDDLTITEKVKFFTELSKTWKEDYEPSAFMTDKEIDQLNKITIKK